MIRRCTNSEFGTILEIINDGAQAYRGVIPKGLWHEPYMDDNELTEEVRDGIVFWGAEKDGELVGVMGIQDKKEVTLIRHAYVRNNLWRQGFGSALLRNLQALGQTPFLVGTWAGALWAISFYEKHGYRLVSETEKNLLLRRYWRVPDAQIATSVVLVDSKWNVDGT